jgi:hypothetical protein
MHQVALQIHDELYPQILKYLYPQKISKSEYETILKLVTSYYQSDLGKKLIMMAGKSETRAQGLLLCETSGISRLAPCPQ